MKEIPITRNNEPYSSSCSSKVKYLSTMAARTELFNVKGTTHPEHWDVGLCAHCHFVHIKEDNETIEE